MGVGVVQRGQRMAAGRCAARPCGGRPAGGTAWWGQPHPLHGLRPVQVAWRGACSCALSRGGAARVWSTAVAAISWV